MREEEWEVWRERETETRGEGGKKRRRNRKNRRERRKRDREREGEKKISRVNVDKSSVQKKKQKTTMMINGEETMKDGVGERKRRREGRGGEGVTRRDSLTPDWSRE